MKDPTMDADVSIEEILVKYGKDMAIKEGLTPTGRKVGIGHVANTSLYRLQFVDDKPGQRKLEAPYDGMYTRIEYAQADMTKYLTDFWETSERAAKRLERKQA